MGYKNNVIFYIPNTKHKHMAKPLAYRNFRLSVPQTAIPTSDLVNYFRIIAISYRVVNKDIGDALWDFKIEKFFSNFMFYFSRNHNSDINRKIFEKGKEYL